MINNLFGPKPLALVCIYFDSEDVIGMAWSMIYDGKSRHIGHKHDTVKKLLSSGIIRIDYAKSKNNVSDPLTKRPN